MDKFVTASSRKEVLSDILIGLKGFKNIVRWRYYFVEKDRNKKLELEDKVHKNELECKESSEVLKSYSDLEEDFWTKDKS